MNRRLIQTWGKPSVLVFMSHRCSKKCRSCWAHLYVTTTDIKLIFQCKYQLIFSVNNGLWF